MIFLRLYRFFSGKVKVAVLGEFCERILNLCAHNGISVWGIRKRGDKITFFMSVRDFKAIRTLLRGSGLRLHILKRRGWPFILRRYRRRWGLFAGVLLFFGVLWFLSGFVWNIGVSGNDKIPAENIKTACLEIGIKEGIRISSVDAWQKRVELMTKVDGLAWAAINIEGCELTVDVTEAPENEKKDYSPCNLVSNANGRITKIEVTSGKTEVAVGDFVAEGEVLASGIFELKNGTTQLVRSEGVILAQVEQTLCATVPYSQKINRMSEKTKKRYALSFFGFKLPLYLGSAEESFVRDDSVLRLSNGSAYLPVYLHCGEYRAVTTHDIYLSADEAAALARENLDSRLEGSEVLNKTEKITESETGVTVEYTVTVLKNIAKEEKLLISTTN